MCDEGVLALEAVKTLKYLELPPTISTEAVDRLLRALPACDIRIGEPDGSADGPE